MSHAHFMARSVSERSQGASTPYIATAPSAVSMNLAIVQEFVADGPHRGRDPDTARPPRSIPTFTEKCVGIFTFTLLLHMIRSLERPRSIASFAHRTRSI